MYSVFEGDCLELLKAMPSDIVDLVVMDPPYQIDNTRAGGKTRLAESIQPMNDELKKNGLTESFNPDSPAF